MWPRLCSMILVFGLDTIGRVIGTLSTTLYDEVMGPEPAPDSPQEIGQFVVQVVMRAFGMFRW